MDEPLKRENGEIAAAVTANRLVFRHIDVGSVGPWGVPTGDSKLRNWPHYAVDPFISSDLDFDAILIDDPFRVHCLLAVASCAGERASVLLTIIHFDITIRQAINISSRLEELNLR